MAPAWSEVSCVREEKRCELILSGAAVSKKIEEEGLDLEIFTLNNLNFLEISHTCLITLPDEIINLTNLTNFVLRGNWLKELNENLCNLTKLKFLDISENQITHLPQDINKLVSLQTLNVSANSLTNFPPLSNLTKLSTINFTKNQFENFPLELCDSALAHLSEVIGSNNNIVDIPSEIENLVSLKTLDLGNNKIVEVPGELSNCSKLKELNLKGNRIKDRRLGKLVDQCHTKQVLEYVRSHCPKKGKENNLTTQSTKGKAKGGKQKKSIQKEEVSNFILKLLTLHEIFVSEDWFLTRIDLLSFLPALHLDVCLDAHYCLHLGVQVWTKLHDTVCEKRTLATIATHDLKKIQGNIKYTAKQPEEIKLAPLGRKNEMSAFALYNQLSDEAEALRKEKKRSTYSGIHKYLYLLKDKSTYPFLLDESGQVISFPPITNCSGTKISEETSDMFFEVTGNSLPACKKVMDSLLYETLKLGLGNKKLDVNGSTEIENESSNLKSLIIEQMRVVDEDGNLKVVYPSRTDLIFEDINVVRD
ncbi:leucine-rich repeat-containing protein 47-like [Centruroides sculpturatus]|uniref:leucine-rich repeat-containing protein 47-like n=1 Tax=Centruroides sculpturatus TaxID=218467 RepID=UPI000C6EA4B2|nr:leucine-rich repeat-containing protein 47-like [Centruroides sculpturatus]